MSRQLCENARQLTLAERWPERPKATVCFLGLCEVLETLRQLDTKGNSGQEESKSTLNHTGMAHKDGTLLKALTGKSGDAKHRFSQTER